MDLTFRTLGPWGAGKGSNLAPSEVDNNFWALAQAIVDLTADPALPVGIANITVSGTQMTITLTDGTVLGPFTLPVLTFRWRGEWAPSTSYAVLDVFTMTGLGIYMVQIAHTSGTAFDPGLLVGGEPALLQLFGSADASLSTLPDVQLVDLHNNDFLRWSTVDGVWHNISLGDMAYQQSGAVNITGGAITGMSAPIHADDVATKAYVDAGPSGTTAGDGTMMSNISGIVAPAIPNSLSAYLDHVLGSTTRGTMLFRGAAAWIALAPGSSGLFLRTQGAGADPVWAAGGSGVTSITAGVGISTGASPITSSGTVALAATADNTILGNAAGASAAPVPLTITQFLDHALTNARGTVLTRNVTGWTALLPGPTGQYLKSQGSGGDLIWDSPLGAGTVTSVAAGTGLTTGGGPITAAGTISFAQIANGTLLANISGSSAAPVANTLSLILDMILSSTQGAVLYRSAAAWAALAPGTSGQFLQTGGSAANPSWANATGSAPIGAAQIPANLTAGTALALGHTLSDILDYTIASARGTLLYRGASGWAGLAPGTSGQVLSTGGPAGDPSWIASSGSSGTPGNFIARRVFTSGTTYTPTSGTGAVLVTIIAGGGAGGGVAVTSAGQQAQGSGGGSGGAMQQVLVSGFSGVAIVVGVGGAAASGADGGNGGASSFGSYTAGAGQGGKLGVATATTLPVLGGSGGTASGGSINIPGSRGFASGILSGRGGSSPLGYGSGGEEQLASAAGVAATGYGSGGGGAINGASQAARAGGNGAAGFVIVDEYGGTVGSLAVVRTTVIPGTAVSGG